MSSGVPRSLALGGVRLAPPRGRRLALLALSWLLVALVSALLLASRPEPPLPGTDLGRRPAPSFRLVDHRGLELGLEDFRGRPVALAFLYSGCPDVCRLTAAGLKLAVAQLGDRAADVQLLAVSVDPAGDDAASVRRFLSRYDLATRMIYFTGPPAALSSVWRDYHLYVDAEHLGLHTDAVYLIDKQGRERSLFRSDFDPTELANALARLAAE